MAVYVDEAMHQFRRMVMCHMVADTRAELDAMADRIGVARRWIQSPGTWREHYDICLSKRRLALTCGAKEVSAREIVALRNRKRAASGEEK